MENVLQVYNFISNNFQAGDELFFFGFSRGAYTTRAAAGLVYELGVLKPATLPAFFKYYNPFIHEKTQNDQSPIFFSDFEPWKQFVASNQGNPIATQSDVNVQVIGVFETVGSLGIPEIGWGWTWHKADLKAYQFYDTNLNDSKFFNPALT